MKIKVNGRNGDSFLLLGVQTNKGNVQNEVHRKVRSWAPSRAKSYTVFSFFHTNYHGVRVEEETGYATFCVEYFTKLNEGENCI